MTTSQIVTSSEENPIEYDRYNIDDYGWMDTTKQFISNLEGGFREKPYRVKNDDGTLGNWTIGHGFEYINGQPVTPQTTITEEQSLQILEDKITEIDSHFLENYPIYGDLSPNQKGAIVSFAFNTGTNVVDVPENRILRKAIAGGDPNKIINAMGLYFNSGGKPNQGLKNRRNIEAQLFLNNNANGFTYQQIPEDDNY